MQVDAIDFKVWVGTPVEAFEWFWIFIPDTFEAESVTVPSAFDAVGFPVHNFFAVYPCSLFAVVFAGRVCFEHELDAGPFTAFKFVGRVVYAEAVTIEAVAIAVGRIVWYSVIIFEAVHFVPI